MQTRQSAIVLLSALMFCAWMAIYPTIGATQSVTPPLDSPLPTPTPTPSKEAQIALNYIADQKGIPLEKLQVVGEEPQTFPLLGRRYTLVTIIHDQLDTFRSFSLFVDPVIGLVEEDVNGVHAAEAEALRAKYGKLEPALYDHLQTVGDDERLPIAIWAAHTAEERTPEALAAEVANLYPEAAKALAEQGVAWAVADPDLRAEIEQKYNQLLTDEGSKRVQPIIEWLKAKGYEVEEFPGMPAVAATVTKHDILELAKLESVSQIYLMGFEGQPASDIAVPTSRVPTVWGRGITGTDIRLAVVETNKINAAADGCLNIIATRDTSLPTSDHKSRVASVAACDDATLRGVAYNAQILDASYTGNDVTSAQAVLWAVNNNAADVVNQSWIYQTDTALAYLDKEYDYLVRAYLFTAAIAAGNESGNVVTPAKGWNVIAVGNVDDKGNASWPDETMHNTSSYINPSTGVEKPEVAAPGTNINTVAGQDTGTSFAAPQVAGLAALLMHRNGILEDWPSAVKAIIMASAVHNIDGDNRLSDKDGAGAIDGALADQIAQTQGGAGACNGPCWWNINTNTNTPPVSGNLERFFNATRGERVRVAIAWLSQADVDGVNDSLRTNYDLYVRQPNNAIVAQSVSANNSFEIVDFTAPATGQYKIQVYRNATGDNNETSNYLGIAWVKLGAYLPDMRRNTADSWTSSLYVRNDDAEPRTIKVTFLNANGSYNTEANTTLNPNALWINPLPPNNWQGSAIVDGSEDLSVMVVQERSGAYTHEAYAGVGNPASDVLVPIVQKNNSGWYSDLFIMNTGGSTTNVTTQFLPAPGYGSSASFTTNNVAAGARLQVNTGSLAIGNGAGVFVGSVRVTNSAGQPLAVASTQYKDSGGVSQMMETSNTQLPATVLYAPLVQNNNSGWLSGLALSRTAGSKFDLYYYRNDNGALCQQQLNLGNNPQIVYPAPPAGNSCPTTPNGKWQSDSTMTANVNQLQGAVNATTYAAIAMPAKTVSIAKVRRDNGWSDGIVIANYNAGAATVTVRIYNTDGTENGSSPVYNQALGAGQSVTILGQIPVGFNGSAVVNATQPVAISANSYKSNGGAGDIIGSYPGNHR